MDGIASGKFKKMSPGRKWGEKKGSPRTLWMMGTDDSLFGGVHMESSVRVQASEPDVFKAYFELCFLAR